MIQTETVETYENTSTLGLPLLCNRFLTVLRLLRGLRIAYSRLRHVALPYDGTVVEMGQTLDPLIERKTAGLHGAWRIVHAAIIAHRAPHAASVDMVMWRVLAFDSEAATLGGATASNRQGGNTMKKATAIAAVMLAGMLLAGCSATLPGKTFQFGPLVCSKGETKIEISDKVALLFQQQNLLSPRSGTASSFASPDALVALMDACKRLLAGT